MLPHRKSTRAQRRKQFPDDFVVESFAYGIQYYVAARFAVAAHLHPVGAALAHHALEAMLKACAAEGATKEQIMQFGYKRNFRHDLVQLWTAFVRQHPTAKLHGFKTLIRELEKFEKIRFAEKLIGRGAHVEVAFVKPSKQGSRPRMRRFILRMDLFDKLVRTIFEVAGKNPWFYRAYFDGVESAKFYKLRNKFPFK